MNKNSFDVIILGAGVSGLAAAFELIKLGKTVLIIDYYNNPGGNHISREFNGLTFDIGAIFFWEDSPLIEMFPGLLELFQPVTYLVGRLTPSNKVFAYPIDFKKEILNKGVIYLFAILSEIFLGKIMANKKESALDFSIYYVGKKFANDSGLLAYIEKFYGIAAAEIGYDLAKHRMQWIAKSGGIRNRIKSITALLWRRLTRSAPAGPFHCYARPRAGFDAMYKYIVSALETKGVQVTLGVGINSIEKTSEDLFKIKTMNTIFTSPRVINTMPLKIACKLASITDEEAPESMSLITLCFSFKGQRGFDDLILYNFRTKGHWKRLTMHSDYYGQQDGYEFFSVECNRRDQDLNLDELVHDFKKTTNEAGLFNGKLELVGHFETEFAYPIYDRTAELKRHRTMAALAAMDIESLGRQGAFEYIPSATLAVERIRQSLN